MCIKSLYGAKHFIWNFCAFHFWLPVYWVLHFNMFMPVSKSRLWFKMSKQKKKEVRNKTLTDSLEISECNGVLTKNIPSNSIKQVWPLGIHKLTTIVISLNKKNVVTFTEEMLNGKLYFLCRVGPFPCARKNRSNNVTHAIHKNFVPTLPSNAHILRSHVPRVGARLT